MFVGSLVEFLRITFGKTLYAGVGYSLLGLNLSLASTIHTVRRVRFSALRLPSGAVSLVLPALSLSSGVSSDRILATAPTSF